MEPLKEESARDMEQRVELAAMKDASTKPRKGESAGVMEQRVQLAAMKDAQTKSKMEESALGMGQGPLKESAAVKDAPMEPLKEESAGVMEQRVQLAVMKDAPTMV